MASQRTVLKNTVFLNASKLPEVSGNFPEVSGNFPEVSGGGGVGPPVAGTPVRVLITRPTLPGGGQVPGTPKGPRGLRSDVPALDGAGFAQESQNVSAESREKHPAGRLETSRYVPTVTNEVRPQRNGAGCPMEWPPGKVPNTTPLPQVQA